MENSIWTRLTRFIRESYTLRIKESFSGICMGFVISNNILFSGSFATLVTQWWWLLKAIGSVILAFVTSLATSYAALLIKQHGERKKKDPPIRKRKDKAA